jgi:DNA replication protein DnaC
MVPEGKVRDLVFRYRRDIVNMIATTSGVLFTGDEGVGKTSAAICLLKEAMSAKYNGYFVTHKEIKELNSERIPTLYGSGADGITVKRYIETADLIVLDGFNDFSDKDYGAVHLEELLMRRASQKLTTIMTTRNADTLRHQKNESLYEAITYCMVPVLIEGKNMRDEVRKEKDDRVKGRI